MKKSSSAKSPKGSDDQLLLQVINKLQIDVSELTSKTEPIFKGVDERQINLVEIDKILDQILFHIHNIQNESSSKINIQNNVEKLQNELSKIRNLKSILSMALNSSKDINHSKIENYLQAKASFSNNLECLHHESEKYQAISYEMKQFNTKELNYTTNEEFNTIKKNFASINQIPIKKYLNYAQSFQLTNNQANNDFIQQFNTQHDRQLDAVNNISNKIDELKVFITEISQIQKEFQDLLFLKDSMNEMIRSKLNDVPNIMQNLENRNKELSDKFREKSNNQSKFFSLIESEARSLLLDANQIIENFVKHNKSMSLMSENEFLNYSNSHKENLQKMNEEIDNLINQRTVVEENNQNNVLSSENLQKVIIGLDGMKNMEKFASHVPTRLKSLEEDQNNLFIKYKAIKAKYEDHLYTIKSIKHYNASKKNDPVYNNLLKLYNKVISRSNELMKNPDNLQFVYSSMASQIQKFNMISNQIEENQKIVNEKVNEFYEMNKNLETKTESLIESVNAEINGIPTLIQQKFADLNQDMDNKVVEIKNLIENESNSSVFNNYEEKFKKVQEEINNLMDYQNKNIIKQKDIDQIESNLSNFSKEANTKISELKKSLTQGRAKQISQFDANFANEIVNRTKALEEFSNFLHKSATDLKNSPFSELQINAFNLASNLRKFASGENILDVDKIISANEILSLEALKPDNFPRISFYSGVINSRDPLIPEEDYKNIIQKLPDLEKSASHINEIKTKLKNCKKQQIDLLSKYDYRESVARGSKSAIPLLSERIRQAYE